MPLEQVATRAQTRIAELDGLRGIAILLVVANHSWVLQALPRISVVILMERISEAGWLGVDIFFVLSGFLITRILLGDGSSGKSFYRNRAFRILPAFLVVFVLGLHFPLHASRLQVFAYLFFLGNFTVLAGGTFGPLSHLWSLAVEEQFYLLWPQAAWRVSKSVLLKIALSLIALSILSRCAAAVAGMDAMVAYMLTPTHLDGIALGCAVAIATQLPSVKEWLARRWKAIAWSALAAFAAGAAILRKPLYASDIRVQLFAIPAISISTAALVFAAAEHRLPSLFSAALRNRILVYFGARSYGLYLIHFPLMIELRLLSAETRWKLALVHPARTFTVTEILGIALSILLAEVCWRLVEQPAQRLKKRWFERKALPSRADHP